MEEALAAVEADAGLIASPSPEHSPQAVACLRAGLGVLVEKPLGLSLASAAEVVTAAEASGRPAVVGQNFRYHRRERAIRKALALGRIGTLRGGAVISTRPPGAVGPHAANPEHRVLWDVAVHHFDLLRTRFARHPATVEALKWRLGRHDSTFLTTLTWPDGAEVVYDYREGPSLFWQHDWMEGDDGAVSADGDRVLLVSRRHRPRRVIELRRMRPEQVLLDHLVTALATGDSPSVSARDNLGTVAMVEAAIRSLRRGEPVDLETLAEDAGVELTAVEGTHG